MVAKLIKISNHSDAALCKEAVVFGYLIIIYMTKWWVLPTSMNTEDKLCSKECRMLRKDTQIYKGKWD